MTGFCLWNDDQLMFRFMPFCNCLLKYEALLEEGEEKDDRVLW